jgi:membrane protease YdiL (CAAX protease family)
VAGEGGGPAPFGLLLEVFDFAVILAVVGLGVYTLVRRLSPLRRWGSQGNVDTARVGLADLAVGFAIVAFSYLNLWALAAGGTQAAGGGGVGDRALQVVGSALLMQVVGTAAVVFYLSVLRGWDLGEAFGLRRMRASQVVLWSLAGTLLLAMPLVVGAIVVAMRWSEAVGIPFDVQEPVQILLGETGWAAKSLLVVSAVVGAPVMEEILFRGFLYPVFKRYSERFFAALVSALFFAVAHSSLGALLPLLVLGLVFVLAYELSGSLLVPVAMHALFNAAQVSQIFGAGAP